MRRLAVLVIVFLGLGAAVSYGQQPRRVVRRATVGPAKKSPVPAPAAPALRRTTLVNDPQHPFSPSELAAMQRWTDRSYVPTYNGRVMVSKQLGGTTNSDRMGGNYAIDPTIDASKPMTVVLQKADRHSLMHELGHAWQYGQMTPQQRDALMKQLHATGNFFDTSGQGSPPMELAADAYMEAALRGPNWKKWWDLQARNKSGHLTSTTGGTAYDYRAGPKRYAAIRSIFNGQ